MRASLVNDELVEEVPQLLFRTPTGVGFLSKSNGIELLDGKASRLIVVSEYCLGTKEKQPILLSELGKIAEQFEKDNGVLSYWVLKDKDSDSSNIIVWERYSSDETYGEVSTKYKLLRYATPLYSIRCGND
jgi:quinol monooxygenase YgiN